MKTVTLPVYRFNELTEEARDSAIKDYLTFLVESYDEAMESETFMGRAIAECERLHTPWFCLQVAWEYGKPEILDILSDPSKWYYSDGSDAPAPDEEA